jgi:hypothetical protein
MGGRGW